MNKVILMGRLTRDPDVRYTQGDNSMCIARYTMAVDRRFSRGNDNDNADFIPCVVFGKSAEFTEKYLKKGTKMAIVGRIQTSSYTNKDGVKVYTTEVVVEEQEFAESKGSGNGAQNGGYTNNGYNQNGGAQNRNYGNGGGNSYQQNAGNNYSGGGQNGNYGNGYANGNNQGGRQNSGYSNGGYNQNGGAQNRNYGNGGGSSYQQNGGSPQGVYQQDSLDNFMNIPDGIDEELPFA